YYNSAHNHRVIFPRQLTRYGGGTMERHRLEQIESYVINFFQERGESRILARELFDSTAKYANADIVRALEDLEKKERLLVRHTTEGNDYISLTTDGVARLGLTEIETDDERRALPHPPKSATK
ncbi:MAG TPA: hypothetical protein VE980_24830, partial [Pyrinomonadaceae bacterium]|nr:hypothetical protein [Pyrinomonadaceae bacterium]